MLIQDPAKFEYNDFGLYLRLGFVLRYCS